MTNQRIYIISLLRSQERRDLVSEEMAQKNIHFTFFDAVDGSQGLPALAQDYDYLKRLWLTSGKMPSQGEIGCYASHYLLWLKCIELNSPIIVCEDDIKLDDRARQIIDIALEKADEYGFLRLEAMETGAEHMCVYQDKRAAINLMKDNYGGLRAYAISPSAAARLIKHRWSLPVDCFVGVNYIHGQYSYQMTPNLVISHGEHESTIQIKDNQKTPLHRKLSRESYSLYKKCMLSKMYVAKKKQFTEA